MAIYNISYNKNEGLNINNIETASIENYILTEGLETSDIASLFSDEDLSEKEILFGPVNIVRKPHFFVERLSREREYLKLVISNIEHDNEKANLVTRLNQIEEVL